MRNSSLKFVAVLLLPLVGLSACGDPKPAATAPAAGADKSAAVEAPAAPTRNPCALLTAAEVEVVLGPLASPPFRSNNGAPDANGGICSYETSVFRAIELSVKWSDNGHTFKIWDMAHGGLEPEGALKQLVKTPEGTTLTGAWDDARVMTCCKFAALHGAQLVTINFGSSRVTVEQAAKLADAAVQRLDKPLSVDATAGSKAAQEHADLRPKSRSVCELVTRAEAETMIGAPMSAEPVGNTNACTYKWVQPDGLKQQMKLSVSWRGGFGEMRFAQTAMGDALSFLKSEGLDTAEEKQSGGTLDEDATNIVGVMAVRKDVMLSVETGPFMHDVAHAFVAKAASKL